MKLTILLQKTQKSLCITTKSLYTNSKFKRNYLENYNDSEHAVKTKKCSIFHDLSEYIIFSYGCKLLDWFFKRKKFKRLGVRKTSIFSNTILKTNN